MKNGLLYKKISEDIRQSIDNGQLTPGSKIPSVNKLREAYGVSHITALRAYKELSNANYIERQKGKGYFVRNHFLKKTIMTGVIGSFIRPLRDFRMDDNYFNDINYGIQSECCVKRINLLRPHSLGVLHQYLPSEEGLTEIKRTMLNIADSIDGFLIDERIPDSVVSEVTEKTGKPAVIVNRHSTLQVDTVGPNDQGGILDALEKTARIGYTQFIFCASGIKNSCFSNRLKAFKEFAANNNISSSQTGIIDNCSIVSMEESFAAIRNMYKNKSAKGKTLIVSETDSIARGLVTSFANINVTAGKDVGILGFGGLGFASNFKPQLSTIEVDPAGIGTLAVKILMKRISSEEYLKPKYYFPKSKFAFGETI